MKTEIEFLAAVPCDGSYYWDGDWLRAAVGHAVTVMTPFNGDSGLFVEFAQLPATKDAILDFAVRYGSAADTFQEWVALITEMCGLVDAWQNGKPSPTPLRLDDIPASVSIVPADDGLTVRVVLRSLEMLLKTQAALAITGGAELRQCQMCERPFLLFPPYSRSTRVYCSRACNTAAYRQRQQLEETKRVTAKKRKPQTKGPRRGRSPQDK